MQCALAKLLLAASLLWAGGATAQPAPVPPPVLQQQVDCSRPQYASDGLVCGDPALLAADADLAARAAEAQPRLADGALWESDEAWFRRRAQCAFNTDHRGCLVAAYADRSAVLSAATAGARPAYALRCDGPWAGRKVQATSMQDATAPIALTEGPDVLGVATAATDTSLWQPLITWRAKGRKILLESVTGGPVSCRISGPAAPQGN